ncbi:hypothetical protein [Luteipulveratus mongoliensis]|uniref:Uncharacterized protein n=1 Tax=Luteipulveratus mongoliensis TaxID=571913 RepID=A0A0K1JKM3_9MICO|nr:hypothetical protein [Luteipulveratus mongoliensis]AKU17251.1 hypothetical protein VV02_17665 [Luteipulveratus mongoliensis]
MAIWNRNKEEPRAEAGGEPLAPSALLELADQLGRECAAEVERLGGDPEQVMATVMFDDVQRVTRVQLTSDGQPMMSGKKFVQALNETAAPLVNQPRDRRLETVDATVADGQLKTQIAYRD